MDQESKTPDRDTSQLSDLPSDLDSSDGDSPNVQTEWLATTRKRRSTAGNRMKSMLANEEPDSDLELLFAEDENDEGFSDVPGDGSDVQMDSSSDDEDDNNANDDDLEGEKELERQAKEKRAAHRKRKAQEAIPAKYRKKVRIDPTTRASVPAPAPRPKKKSERTSWLPSPADLPTRASSRKTTRISKEQLHQQMVEREARRLKQLAQMEKKAARLEALKKPPMTQEERLAEAAVIEKRNSKSLNRWEEAEKQREEERKARLAALSQRTLKGPVITFWSGKGQWDDAELRSLRPYVTEVEEKPKKKREKGDKGAKSVQGKGKDNEKHQSPDMVQKEGKPPDGDVNNVDGASSRAQDQSPGRLEAVQSLATEKPTMSGNKAGGNDGNVVVKDTLTSLPNGDAAHDRTPMLPASTTQSPVQAAGQPVVLGSEVPTKEPSNDTDKAKTEKAEAVATLGIKQNEKAETVEESTDRPAALATGSIGAPVEKEGDSADVARSQLSLSSLNPSSASHRTSETPSPSHPLSGLAAPLPDPRSLASPSAAPVGVSGLPPTSRPSSVLAAPILAPPPGVDFNGSPQVEAPKSSVLAPPNTLQTTLSPLSIQAVDPVQRAEPLISPVTTNTNATGLDAKQEIPPDSGLGPAQSETALPTKSESPSGFEAQAVSNAPLDTNATRNGIIYQNFDGYAIRDKVVQTQILFGRKMTKLAKPAPAPICVITNNPARYRDPKTSLPFYNMHAYKEIQRLNNGDYKWSRILGAWVGNTQQAARGVPERFTNPSSVKSTASQLPQASTTKQEESSGQKKDNNTTNLEAVSGAIVKTEGPSNDSERLAQPIS